MAERYVAPPEPNPKLMDKALSTRFIDGVSSSPMRSFRRFLSMVRICSRSTTLSFERPHLYLNMGGQLCLFTLACDGGRYNSGTVTVAHIVLNDKYRTYAALLGAYHGAEIGVIYFSSFNRHFCYHPFLISEFIVCLYFYRLS